MGKSEVSMPVKIERRPATSRAVILGWTAPGKPGWITPEISEGACLDCGEIHCMCGDDWMNADSNEVLGL